MTVVKAMLKLADSQFVLFRDLSRTTDTLSPVVVPRAMNTHQDLWSRENFKNIYVLDITSPGSINSLLNCYGEDEAGEDSVTKNG